MLSWLNVWVHLQQGLQAGLDLHAGLRGVCQETPHFLSYANAESPFDAQHDLSTCSLATTSSEFDWVLQDYASEAPAAKSAYLSMPGRQ